MEGSAGLGEGIEFESDALGSVGVSLSASGGPHRVQPAWVAKQDDEGMQQAAGHREVGLFEHEGRTGINHRFGIAFLVLVGSSGKWDQKAGLAGSRQLCNRGCSAARDHEVGFGETGRHVIEEGRDAPAGGVGTGCGVGSLRGFGKARAGLVQDG